MIARDWMLSCSFPSEHLHGLWQGPDGNRHGLVALPINTDPALCVAAGLEDEVRGRERQARERQGWTSNASQPPGERGRRGRKDKWRGREEQRGKEKGRYRGWKGGREGKRD